MNISSKVRAAEGPKTVRERVAYALAAHDTYGNTRYTRLLDEELEELHGICNFLGMPSVRPGAPHYGTLHVLLRTERAARGWDPPITTHLSVQQGIVEETWPEWLPMADAVLTALMVFPEVAALLARPTAPAKPAELPSPVPKLPKSPGEAAGPPPRTPPPKRAKRPKAA